MRRYIHRVMVTIFLMLIFYGSAIAQGAGGDLTALPNLLGSWSGKAEIMLPGGITEQVHLFEFTEQQGAFLKGRHSWDIPARNLTSNDGRKQTYQSTESFLGVIAHDGTITLVEYGDDTRFSMRLLNRYTLDFIATEGGDHPLVGHGVIVRQRLSFPNKQE